MVNRNSTQRATHQHPPQWSTARVCFHSHETCGLSVESLKVSGPPICLEGPDGSIRKQHSKGLQRFAG